MIGSIGKFNGWQGNPTLNFTRKTVLHESWSDECDITFLSEIQCGIHESGIEFFLNHISQLK